MRQVAGAIIALVLVAVPARAGAHPRHRWYWYADSETGLTYRCVHRHSGVFECDLLGNPR